VTLLKARDRLGRMTLSAMANARGRISRIEARRGTKKPKLAREMVHRVSQVRKKWKAAKESCASFRDWSEKMALFVKT